MMFKKNDKNYIIHTLEPVHAELISSERNGGDRLFLKDSSMLTVTQTEHWIKNLPKTSQRLVVDDEFEIVGIIRIDNIDQRNGTCFVGLDIYSEHRGQGLARPIYREILNYVFNSLNCEYAYLEVIAGNERAKHLYYTIGFRECGRWPGQIKRDGKRHDAICYYLEAAEWRRLDAESVNSDG